MNAIIATDILGGIGKDGSLPWPRLSEDLVNFRLTTWGHTVLMGQKTAESFQCPLINRVNAILTSSKTDAGQYYIDLHQKMAASDHDINFKTQKHPIRVFGRMEDSKSVEAALLHDFPDREIWVIGGSQVYTSYLPLCQTLVHTQINDICMVDTNVDLTWIDSLFDQGTVLSEHFEKGIRYTIVKRNRICNHT